MAQETLECGTCQLNSEDQETTGGRHCHGKVPESREEAMDLEGELKSYLKIPVQYTQFLWSLLIAKLLRWMILLLLLILPQLMLVMPAALSMGIDVLKMETKLAW